MKHCHMQKKKVIKKEINTNDLKRKYLYKKANITVKRKKEVNNYQPEQN